MTAAHTAPQADPVPPTFRERIRNQLPADVARQFDELCAWEDDILKALNLASEAADRMADALEQIERMSVPTGPGGRIEYGSLRDAAEIARKARNG